MGGLVSGFPFLVPKFRTRTALVAGIVALTAVLSLAFAPTASANTRSNWSGIVDGVEYGWTQNHFWLITSYANAIKIGSGKVAGLVCDAISDGGIGPVCDAVVKEIVGDLIRNESRLTNHGIWAAIYPQAWGHYYIKDGRY